MKSFGVPAVVAINHFVTDTDAEVAAVKAYVEEMGSEAILCKHWEHGSKGVTELATRVAEIADSGMAQFSTLYPDDMGLFQKIETVAKRIYRADEVLADKKIRDQLKAWEEAGYGHLPVCMAKTQYSLLNRSEPARCANGPLAACTRSALVCGCRLHCRDSAVRS